MHVNFLSSDPTKPCILLKWPNVSILLDCAIDLSPFYHFLPHIFSQYKTTKKFDILKAQDALGRYDIGNRTVYIEGHPQTNAIPLKELCMETVDCILISNWNSLVALPYYVHNTGFKGSIYATEPVMQFGKLMILEMLEYYDRIVIDRGDERWKKSEDVPANHPWGDPSEWKHFYSREIMEATLSTITPVAWRQSFFTIDNIKITAYSSGYHIGSCNWVIEADEGKISYLAASSARNTHSKPVDWEKVKEADIMLLTSLSPIPDNSPLSSMQYIRELVSETLKKGGNVLIPTLPVGPVFDLLDLIAACIDNTTGVPLDTPIYFISPQAKSALAYSNVNAEYLSSDKQNNVFIPLEPFLHTEYIKNGRLKVYDSLYDSFSKEYKTPCVVLCGHPTLRIGDAAHLLQLWGNDNKNVLISTNPDFPLQQVYEPFRELAVRAYFYPIDSRLDFAQVNNTLINDLKPKCIYAPEQYSKPMFSRRKDLVLQFSHIVPVKENEPLLIKAIKGSKRKIRVHPEILKKLEAKSGKGNTDYGLCHLSGFLSTYDDDFELLPAKRKARSRYTGKVTSDIVMKAIQKRNLQHKLLTNSDGSFEVDIESLKATLRVNKEGTRTTIKKFAEQQQKNAHNVKAYRADLASLLGIGRKKLLKLPAQLFPQGTSENSLQFLPTENFDESGCRFRKSPILVSVIPISSQQAATIESLKKNVIMHHAGFDQQTMYRYGAVELLTFLDVVHLSHLLCSVTKELDFYSHSVRRHSALFQKLFDIRLLRNQGFQRTSFHPSIPKPIRSSAPPHCAKLEKLDLHYGLHYAVSIKPRTSFTLNGHLIESNDDRGNFIHKDFVFLYGFWMDAISKFNHQKKIEDVLKLLAPESSSEVYKICDRTQKIGDVSDLLLEQIFLLSVDEIRASTQLMKYQRTLKVNRESKAT
ncbi:unnamed protein product [Auanema sp. JU1783]|nr:unnamed protein product [Auanema sp. JU1783]